MSLCEVTLYGKNAHECGYCKSGQQSGSVSFGFTSENISSSLYEQLMLEGWRRSGSYFYKPLLHETCCPPYTIRLNVDRFEPSKSQRKVLRKSPRLIEIENDHEPVEDGLITVFTERARFSDEKFDLYRRYQVAVHKDKENEVTPEGFTRFLVDSPLNASTNEPLLGSFHQLYRLGEKLIAVGVIDILPSGVSSVYCFYDPDMRSLVLGKLTALQEIEYCKCHSMKYYYMGFYIHNCEKMRYKAEYSPSELLCPITFTWHDISKCTEMLDKFEFTPLDKTLAERRSAMGVDASSTELSSLYKQRYTKGDELKLALSSPHLGDFTLEDLSPRSRQFLMPILSQWIELVGMDAAIKIKVIFP